jgi:hypothetical protein
MRSQEQINRWATDCLKRIDRNGGEMNVDDLIAARRSRMGTLMGLRRLEDSKQIIRCANTVFIPGRKKFFF